MQLVIEYFSCLPALTVMKDIFDVYFRDDPKAEVPNSLEDKIEAIAEDVWATGLEALVKSWSTDLLSVIRKNFRIAFPENRNPEHRSVMIKSIVTVLDSEGFGVFRSYSTSFLSNLLEEKDRHVEEVLSDPILYMQQSCAQKGLAIFFHQFNEKLLAKWCREVGVANLKTSSKKTLIHTLLERRTAVSNDGPKSLKRAADDVADKDENKPPNKKTRFDEQ
jgi:hypothetical protein